MPIYEYKCSKCEHQFEIIQRISDIPIEVCPECNQLSVNKLVSAPSFRLKGGGWYETDFKTGSKKNIVDTKDEKPNKPKEETKTTDQSKSKKPEKKPKQER
ncbi:MAG: zinc ribbon domain-containing protein [Proteobacteria bacterium]|nr:zinc ribbon domain-containing protein [Pseudomonadota bacterium]